MGKQYPYTLPSRSFLPLWETPWALLAYLAAFILPHRVNSVYLLYIYRLRHQVNMEQQLSNIKLKFFTDISHELRTPLTLISSPVSEVLEDQTISPSVREHLTVVHKKYGTYVASCQSDTRFSEDTE